MIYRRSIKITHPSITYQHVVISMMLCLSLLVCPHMHRHMSMSSSKPKVQSSSQIYFNITSHCIITYTITCIYSMLYCYVIVHYFDGRPFRLRGEAGGGFAAARRTLLPAPALHRKGASVARRPMHRTQHAP